MEWILREVLIGGQWSPAEGGTYEIVDPSTEEAIGAAPEAPPAQVQAACRAAREAFEFGPWPALSGAERGACLLRAADRIEKRAPELIRLAMAETGSTRSHADQVQVRVAAERLRMYAALAGESNETVLPPLEREPIAGSSARTAAVVTSREPVGVVVCICPANTPATNCAGKVGPALAMGNTVVMKPPVQDPLGMAELARELDACLPPGVVNYVAGRAPEIGEALVASPDVDMISFTGSTHVGRRIAEVAGRGMKRTLLELGGKSASIVFADCGGRRPPDCERGFFYEPTLLTSVDNRMEVAQQEIFGPVIAAIPFDDGDEAVRIANDSEFGLYGYVWTADAERAQRVAKGIRTGTVQINGAPPNPWAPFGGFKQSGVGRDGGRYGLEAYSELKYLGWAT
ncbi:MAG: aldehyde dehydrogenase family protein [Candidatus Binatia bacterium]|nr:aldehyde dehydrogenase family protein [Candidatus Binatia bacterium]